MVIDKRPDAPLITPEIGAAAAKEVWRMQRRKQERPNYNTTLKKEIIKKLRHLSIDLERRQNDLLEEAILDLIKKYEKKSSR